MGWKKTPATDWWNISQPNEVNQANHSCKTIIFILIPKINDPIQVPFTSNFLKSGFSKNNKIPCCFPTNPWLSHFSKFFSHIFLQTAPCVSHKPHSRRTNYIIKPQVDDVIYCFICSSQHLWMLLLYNILFPRTPWISMLLLLSPGQSSGVCFVSSIYGHAVWTPITLNFGISVRINRNIPKQ